MIQHPVPQIPKKTLDDVHACLVSIVTTMQGLLRQQRAVEPSLVTVQDLLDLGLIDQNDANRLSKGIR